MRRRSKPELAALAALAYVPFLLSSPGRVSADNKQYLYLDPGRFLARTLDLWDPSVGAGTVPHQHLGYAFPVAPFYWVLDRIGIPDWVAQRLWLGTLTFLAAAGALWLFRELGTGRLGALAGAMVYCLSPYQLAFTARISVLLLPWVALPWLVGLTARATRTRDWRAPAALGLVLVAAGGINASSLLLVGLGPVLWVVVEGSRGRAPARLAATATLRIGLVALAVSAWWLVGIRLQGRYGLPVLQLTEDLRVVAERSLPGDVLRGLGNWFFYGRDPSGFSLDQAAAYESSRLVYVLSYAVPVVALVVAMCLRWAHRAYFALLVLAGVVVAVGSWPIEDPSPYGSLWRELTETSIGLAFRNSPRAVPLVVLGLAGLLAAAVGSLPRPPWNRVAAGAVAVLALGALLPVWQEGYLSDGVDRPEDIPDYWRAAVEDLDAGDHRTRILELPGSTFAAYRWGSLVDPLTPGLTDRPYLAREVLPHGTPASVNLLDALDRRAQLGVLEAASVAPIARLLGVGTVSLRADLEQSARAFSPPPAPVWEALLDAQGLGTPRAYGPTGFDPDDPDLPAVALFDVDAPRPIVRTAPSTAPVVVAGDGDGLVDAAAAGLLDGRALVLQSAALDDAALAQALEDGADLVLTDSNRRRIQTWFYALRDTRGPTERAGRVAPDPTGYDFRLDPFPEAGDDSRTVVEQLGATVETTSEGGPDRPEDRGAGAADGNPDTAWRVGGPDARGEAITLIPDAPVTTDGVRLLQPDAARTGRRISRVRLTTDVAPPVEVDLGPASLEGVGQWVPLPEATVASLQIEIVDTVGDDLTPVGLAEIGLGSTRVAEVVRLPVDLLDRVGPRLDGHGLDVVLTRLRLDVPEPDRRDDEAALDRRFELPAPRAFSVEGTVRTVDGSPPTPDGTETCRDDLVQIDGEPVPVRITASDGAAAELVACEAVTLRVGSHRVTATLGTTTGLDVDRLVLSSTPGGAPGEVAARGAGSEVAPVARVTSEGSAAVDVEVDEATSPFWLVLGQSASDGWVASADGASVGPRTLVDGYANGWLITPDGNGAVSLALRWTPQRLVWAGIATSLAAVLACIAVLVLGRRRPGRWESTLGAPPRTRLPTRRAVPPAAAVRAVLIVGLGTALVADLLVAGTAAVLTAVAATVPGGRWVLVTVAPTTLLLARPLDRPMLAWLAVALLAADLVLGRDEVSEPTAPA